MGWSRGRRGLPRGTERISGEGSAPGEEMEVESSGSFGTDVEGSMTAGGMPSRGRRGFFSDGRAAERPIG